MLTGNTILVYIGLFALILAIATDGTAARPTDLGIASGEGSASKEIRKMSTQHTHPAGASRSAWVNQIDGDLSGAEMLAVRLTSSTPVPAILDARSGEGKFRREIQLTRGEQIALVPLGAFAREGAVRGWNTVSELTVSVQDGTEAEIHLLDITALPENAMPPGEELLLLRPVSRVHPVGMAWPIRAILHDPEYSEQDEQPDQALQGYLKRMYGVELPINPDGMTADNTSANVVLIGGKAALNAGAVTEAELERQGYSGFLIRTDEGRIVIAGMNRHGTMYGVHRFLEEQGCRFLGHGVEDIPRRKQPVLNICEAAEKPFFPGKRIGGSYSTYGMPSSMIGDPRVAAAAHGEQDLFDRTLWIDHTAAYLVPEELFYNEHPEYYALRADGTRLPKETSDVRLMICTTHPDVLRISVDRALRWIEHQNDRKYFVVMQSDDFEWCRCSWCLSMMYEPGNYSDAMLYWVNHVARAVAERFPDKIILCHAYGPTQPAPVKLKPEPNVHVM